MVIAHFVKRELETLLYAADYAIFLFVSTLTLSVYSVHRFSHATMPAFNIFKKCASSPSLTLTLLQTYDRSVLAPRIIGS